MVTILNVVAWVVVGLGSLTAAADLLSLRTRRSGWRSASTPDVRKAVWHRIRGSMSAVLSMAAILARDYDHTALSWAALSAGGAILCARSVLWVRKRGQPAPVETTDVPERSNVAAPISADCPSSQETIIPAAPARRLAVAIVAPARGRHRVPPVLSHRSTTAS
jgi:hypothetical protein